MSFVRWKFSGICVLAHLGTSEIPPPGSAGLLIDPG